MTRGAAAGDDDVIAALIAVRHIVGAAFHIGDNGRDLHIVTPGGDRGQNVAHAVIGGDSKYPDFAQMNSSTWMFQNKTSAAVV